MLYYIYNSICYIDIVHYKIKIPLMLKHVKIKGMGQIASLRQERSSCSATVGRLDCTQHGIGRLLLIRQAIARDAGPRAPPRDPRGVCFSGTASS